MLADLEADKKAKDLARKKEQALNNLRHAIREHGTLVRETMSINDIPGTVVSDTMNVYGGGMLISVDDSTGKAWLVINNGADGDDWSINTIRTGGAGAYGYIADLDTVRPALAAYTALA